MATRRIIFCHDVQDTGIAVSLAGSLEEAGFECRLTGDARGGIRNPEDFQWSEAMVVLLSEAANTSDTVRRGVEEAANSGLRLIPVKLDGSAPSKPLRYYLGPLQWLEPGDVKDFARRFTYALDAALDAPGKTGNGRRSSMLWSGAAMLTTAVVTLAVLWPGSGDGSTEEAPAVTSCNADILIVGPYYQSTLPTYLCSLGYTVDSTCTLPASEVLTGCDVVLLCMKGSPDLDLPLYEYVRGGGSLLLMGGQPYFMGMPAWIGMRTYSNYWGGDFPVTFTSDSVLGVQDIRHGGTLSYYTTFVDGAAVLKDPTTAVVDACFNGEDSMAAAVRNTVGSGRLAWVYGSPEPHADVRGNDYSTEGFEKYLEALYAWLDRDGPESTVR